MNTMSQSFEQQITQLQQECLQRAPHLDNLQISVSFGYTPEVKHQVWKLKAEAYVGSHTYSYGTVVRDSWDSAFEDMLENVSKTPKLTQQYTSTLDNSLFRGIGENVGSVIRSGTSPGSPSSFNTTVSGSGR